MNGIETTEGLELNQLVSFYIQQNSAVNQLWSMYAVTAFAAAVFAVNAGTGPLSNWVRLAGLLGFLCFTVGHYHMVVSGAIRLKLTAADIARIRGNRAAGGPQTVVDHLAGDYSVRATKAVHILIDVCVLIAFAAMGLAGMSGSGGTAG